MLLEHRLGEYPLPPGTWVVAAGNRVEDRALVRALSSALVNRVILLHVRTVDEFVSPEELLHYRIAGYGGSDMGRALVRLAEDPEVEAVLVLTDGYIDCPAEAMPHRLLWVLSGQMSDEFAPPYGHVLRMPTD